jgi:hypothetical protein
LLVDADDYDTLRVENERLVKERDVNYMRAERDYALRIAAEQENERLVALSSPQEAGLNCDCTKYNGGQCYNCLNGHHEICDSGQGRCSKTPAPSAQPGAQGWKDVAVKMREIVCRRVGPEGELIPALTDEEIAWMDEIAAMLAALASGGEKI